jgi:alkylated DNA repair dioxygenase AlkB
MEGILHINNFITEQNALFNYLRDNVEWDGRMTARKTASFGVAYNYSQMSYPYQQMTSALKNICSEIEKVIGFEPNNCLVNYYLDGKSKMGFHADQTDILETNTGIAIVSLGETRILRFRNIEDKSKILDYELTSGSLVYMTQAIQEKWEHAIPKSDTDKARMSLTLRKIVNI